jgi:hypothetical protein
MEASSPGFFKNTSGSVKVKRANTRRAGLMIKATIVCTTVAVNLPQPLAVSG